SARATVRSCASPTEVQNISTRERTGILKDITECHARLRGLFNITVTPFKADGAFDFAGLARNVERVIGLGFDGILIGGTYGEFPAMSPEERADLFRRVMDIVGDRVPVMLCSADSDVRVVR